MADDIVVYVEMNECCVLLQDVEKRKKFRRPPQKLFDVDMIK